MFIAEAATHSNAYTIGHSVGEISMLILLLAGIVKCAAIARRPETNTKCVLGLMLLVIAWFTTAIYGFLLGLGLKSAIAGGLFGLLSVGLVLSAILFSILGLIEYKKHSGRFRQGRAQAVWGLILSGILLVFAVVGIFSAARKNGRLAKQPHSGETLVFNDYNFRFSAPGRPWTEWDAKKLNPVAKLAFIRSRPEMFFMIIPERLGNSELTTDSLADFAAAHLRSAAESARVLKRFPSRIGRLDGLRVQTEARVRDYDLFYTQWFFVTNGWSYQLMAWGRTEDQKEISREADRFFEGFEIIDPERRPPREGKSLVTDFVSTNFQYRVRCADFKAIEWTKLDTDCPYATFGVLNRDGVALAVSAVHLMDLPARPDAIYRGFLNIGGLFDGEDPLKRARAIHENGLEGIATTLTREGLTGKKYSYRLKVLQGRGVAYLVMAWVDSNHERKDALLDDAMSRVEFLDGPILEPDPSRMSPREKRAHQMLLNSIGMIYYKENQFEQSARYFKTTVELGGILEKTPYLANLAQAYTSAGRFRDALDELNSHADFVKSHPNLEAREAFLEARLGSTESALAIYSRLFANGFSNDAALEEYVRLLSENGNPEQALTEIEKLLEQRDTPDLRVTQARLLEQLKRTDKAIALLETERARNPFHLGVAYSLGDAYIQVGRANDALKLSEKLFENQGESPTAWILKGRAQFALKWYRDAKISFEQAAKEAPSDATVQQFLEIVSSALGEGSTAGIKTEIQPVKIPDELLKTQSVAKDAGREEGACYLRDVHAVSFKKGKELRQTDYVTVRTLTAKGISAFSTFQIRFEPMNEELFVNALQVRDAAGMLVSTGRVSDYYVLDNRSGLSANNSKILNIPVSGLQPGAVIELTISRRLLGTCAELPFLPNSFARGYPGSDKILYLTGDTQAVRYVSSPVIEPEKVADGLLWRQTNPTLIRWEPDLPARGDYLPTVWLGDASAKWPELVTNYLGTIRDRLESSDEIEALAKKITDQSTNAAQKISAIAAYVQTNYTYKAIEFGRRARIPHSIPEILRNRYGDCKDHALLARQLLDAAGIPASLALVNVKSSVRKDVPSLDQFDHMIVYVSRPSGDVFLDCTDKGANLGEPWTDGLAGQDALILDGRNPRFVRIPDYPTNASCIQIERAIVFTNRSDALVSETLKFEGVHAAYLRDFLAGASSVARRSYIARFTSSPGEILNLEINGIEQPELPLELKVTYLLRDQFHRAQGQLSGSLPAGCENAYLAEEPVEKRLMPFEIAIPLTVETSVTVTPPEDYKARISGASPPAMANSFITSESKNEARGNNLHFTARLFRPAGRFPASDYARHSAAVRDAIQQLEPRIVCERIK